jgi:GMP synthase (glutamine-hydrolysing)
MTRLRLGARMAGKGAYKDLVVHVIDNGGQWTHREWRVLKYLGVSTKILPNDTPWSELAGEGLHGIILSGGAPRVGVEGTLGRCDEILDNAEVPILGICAGHQFIARHFGGEAAPGEGEFGATQMEILDHDEPDLLAGVPQRSIVWESHHDEVTQVPDGFEVLARSDRCNVQAMRDTQRRVWGVQFHPEVEHTQHGVRMFENFLRQCRTVKAPSTTDAQSSR